jgi:hypothetical protein
MIQHKMFELSFHGEAPKENQAQVDLTAVFTNGETSTTVKGFYDGDNIYKVRFLPEQVGAYQWHVSGAVEAQGSEFCHTEAKFHGKVTVEDYHFRYMDGTKYIPFGTTVYALAHQPDELAEQTLNTLKASPFNKVRMCVFPKYYQHNHNEPPFYPFEKDGQGKWNVSRPCFHFWHRFERILDQLEEMNIQVDLILFHPYDRWGFADLSPEENAVYLDTVLRRLAARPGIWWSLANEYDLCLSKTTEDWYAIEQFVSKNDPFHHLLSNHNCFQPWDFTRPATTHASIQTKTLARINEWRQKYHKPVIIDECGYEGNLPEPWGNLSAFEMTARFWSAMVAGGFCTHGETFLDDENDVIWWAKGGVLKGKSPARIAFLRRIMESLPGPIEPIPSRLMEALNSKKAAQAKTQMASLPKKMRGFANLILTTDPMELRRTMEGDMVYKGRCGNMVFLIFYDRHCCAQDTIELPEDAYYTIEVIDIWKMTRTTIANNASGKVTVDLPGKEGIAVLATRVSENSGRNVNS